LNRKSFIISVLTVFVQYYDYHLFGFLAAKIAINFFPAGETISQLLSTYLIMTLAMIAKPAGAIIFGKIGDIQGRSNSFSISLIGTAIASLIIFIVPSYEKIGILSAFILLIARMAICAFVSSGSDGVRLYVYEHLDKSRQCLGIGITTIFTQAGSLTASLSAWLFTLDILPGYSWRFAFLLGSLMGVGVLIVMRLSDFSDGLKVEVNPEFERFKEQSIAKIIKTNRKLFTLCLLLAGSIGSTTQFVIIFFGTFNFQILQTIDSSKMQNFISIAIFIYMVLSIISGYLADRFGRYPQAVIGAFCAVIFSMLQALELSRGLLNPAFYFLSVASLPFITMPAAAILKESIPVSIRYRLFSLSHAVGSIVISAPTAYICTLLYKKTNLPWLPISYFIVTILMISFALYKLQKPNDDKNTFKQHYQ
jgi:MFS family permease